MIHCSKVYWLAVCFLALNIDVFVVNKLLSINKD